MDGIVVNNIGDSIIIEIHNLSEELKEKIKEQLVEICQGEYALVSASKYCSFEETIKELVNYRLPSHKNKKIGEIIVNERLGIDSLKDAKYIDVDKKEFIYSIDKEITHILGSKNEKYKITTSIYMEKGFDLEFVIENEGKTATIKKEISVAYNK